MKYLFNIFRYVKELWPYYVGIIVLSLIISALTLAVPFIMKAATDLIVENINNNTVDLTGILWIAGGLLAIDISSTLISNWSGYLGDIMSARLKQTLSNRYYEHLLSLPQSFYDTELTGKIINRLNRTISEVTRFINMFANNTFNLYLTLIFSLVVMYTYSWEMATLMLVVYPLFMWLTAITSKKWQVWQKEINQETDIASGRFAEAIGQIKVVKSFIREKSEYKEFSDRNKKIISVTKVQSKYWHRMDNLRRIVLNIIFFVVTAYLFYFTMIGRFSIGDMVLLMTLMTQMRAPIFSMSFIIDAVQRAIAGSRDYFEVMSVEPAVADAKGATELKVTKGKIEFENVDFGYQADKRVLHDISFEIKPNEKIALVGESGEGKTTVTSLLLRLYDIDTGNIKIDSQPIRKVTQKSLRENIAVVFQDPALFSGTIRENITYGNLKASDEEIIEAAKAANAHEFIEKFDNGYDTEIGERGLKLSGGQKQRIAIARAILKDSPILILDEATSSLDSKSEKMVQEALDRLMKGRTTIIIAHRLSTIAEVDKIVTIRNGRVDEIGSPKQLAKTDGIYGQLLKLQLGKTEKDKKRLAEYEIST